ncbi:MAG: substrate-binding domain-containing protein [Chloroflexota bacterium]
MHIDSALEHTPKFSRRDFLRAGLLGGTATLLTSCLPSCGGFLAGAADGEKTVRQAANRQIVIQVQHPFGGSTMAQLVPLWDAYETVQDEVGIEATFVPNDLSANEALFAAVAAGQPPHVTWVDGPQVAEWAERGILESLTDHVEAAGLNEEDFWVPCWRQNEYQGQVWALTHTADANFGFFWNKRLFSQADLDPEWPPTTVDEVRTFNQILTKRSGNEIQQTGIIPWSTYGFANAMFTWGWLFGGQFFDYEANAVTADHERNVQALEWMVAVGNDGGGFAAVADFEQSISGDMGHLFFQDVLGMAFLGPWELANIERVAPDLEYGITYAPAGPTPAEPKSSWVGGWSIGLPKGATETDAAWDFISWACASDEGTSLYGQLFNQTPGYRRASWYDVLAAEQPRMAQFIEILETAKHQRPVMPAQATYMGTLQAHVEEALLGYVTPQDALASATVETQATLDEILERGFGEG